jgi:Ca2+-binding EF-hand superfamily protein
MSKEKMGIFLLAFGFLVGVGCASRPPKESPPDTKGLFQVLDRNKDGRLSLEEYQTIWKSKGDAEREFRQLDRNKDGFLTLGELQGSGITIFRW